MTSTISETTKMTLDEDKTEETPSTEVPADPSVTDMVTTTVKSITDLISTISSKPTTDSVPTEASTALDSEMTTVQTIIPSTTQQAINLTTVDKIESTDEVTFITTVKPDIEATTTSTLPSEQETTESATDSDESQTETTLEDKITTTIKSITDFISTISSVTTASPTTVADEDIEDNEIIPDVKDEEEDTSHTLKCTPSTSMGPTPDGTPFDCKDEAATEDISPFIVIIRISSDDLSSVLTKRVKVVVKDFMLMDMPAVAQQPLIDESLSPK